MVICNLLCVSLLELGLEQMTSRVLSSLNHSKNENVPSPGCFQNYHKIYQPLGLGMFPTTMSQWERLSRSLFRVNRRVN